MRSTSNLFRTFGNYRSVITGYIPIQYIFIQIGEIEPVFHTNRQILLANQCALDILIDFLHFQQMGMRFANGIYKSVTAEITKTGNIFRTVITTISPIPLTILVDFTERLIDPIPNTTTLGHRFTFEHIPVFLHAATTVAHGMQVFAKDERTVDILTGHVIFNHIHAPIHAAIDIRIIIFLRTFVLYRTILFYRFQPVIRTFEINSISGFVA